jgi:hypothetical protein
MKRCFALILLILTTSTLFAQNEDKISKETRIAKESATIDGDRGLFTVASSETLNQGQYSYGIGWNNTALTPLSMQVKSGNIYFSYGLRPRLTVTGTFTGYEEITAGSLTQPGYNYQYPFVTSPSASGIGDTTISAKYKLWRQAANNIGGMALKGFVKFGTASASKGLGTGTTAGGADLIFTSVLPFKFLLDSSFGYTFTQSPTLPFLLGTKNQLRSTLGTAWPAAGIDVAHGTIQGIFEYTTLTFVGGPSAAGDAAPTSIQDPSNLAAGLRYMVLDRGISVNAGYQNNIKFDTTFPGNKQAVGFVIGVSYSKPVSRSNGNNHAPVIAIEADSTEIAIGGSAVITASVYDADNDPLTYSWSAASGQIIGSGEKVTFNAAGLTAGTYTIQATASDSKGGLAKAQIEITVRP